MNYTNVQIGFYGNLILANVSTNIWVQALFLVLALYDLYKLYRLSKL